MLKCAGGGGMCVLCGSVPDPPNSLTHSLSHSVSCSRVHSLILLRCSAVSGIKSSEVSITAATVARSSLQLTGKYVYVLVRCCTLLLLARAHSITQSPSLPLPANPPTHIPTRTLHSSLNPLTSLTP